MSLLKFNGLSEVLEWKYGRVADTKEIGDEMTICAWRHPSIAQPDRAQLILDFQEYDAHRAAILYQSKRAAEYPAIGDQLDALWKAVGAIADGKTPPKEATDLLASIEAVKAKYPKP